MTSSLPDLVEPESILLDATADDWTAAVRIAGRLLEQAGVATAEYTQAMIDNVVDNGPYIVIAPGFAFAHARPSPAVKHTGMSWVRLATPVEFGHAEHDPVHLVVALAAADSDAHLSAMAELAGVIGDDETRAALERASSPEQVHAILRGQKPTEAGDPVLAPTAAETSSRDEEQHLILTVCGNGLGTSLFLKNTLEGVLSTWGWDRYLIVEATDTISARGRASEAKAMLTSGEIAKSLGDVGIPVRVIENFTSQDELDQALRELYDV